MDHNVIFYSQIWFVAKNSPLRFDRTLSQDDHIAISRIYPTTTFVPSTGSVSGTCANQAIVVAIDSLGLPVAAVKCDNVGAFQVTGLPPGSYTLKAHHNFNYFINSPSFAGAASFLSATDAAGVVVTAGGSVTGLSLPVSPGSPTMKARRIGDASTVGTRVQLLPQGTSQFVRVNGPGLTGVTSGDFGPGVTITSGPVAGPSIGGDPCVDFTVSVNAAATPGPRVLTLNKGAERLLAAGMIFVPATGSLSMAPGAANPGASMIGASASSEPMLQVAFTAGPEDARIRSFTVASAGTGSEPVLLDIRLFEDVNGNGAVDAGDRRILTSAAFANSPANETKTFASDNGTILFDNLAEQIPASTTRNWLVVADFPAAGTGTFTFSAGAVVADGMLWGDSLAVAGAATGGTKTFDPSLSTLSALRQTRLDTVTDIAVGSFTDEAAVVFQGLLTNSGGFTVKMQVELQPIATPFTGVFTAESALLPTGSTAIVTIPVVNGTNYHWQARAVNQIGIAAAWLPFGGTPDFGVDTGAVSTPAGLDQRNPDGSSIVVGTTSSNDTVLFAATGTHSLGFQVRLEVEVRPLGTPFTDVPTSVGPLVASGAPATLSVGAGFDATYHWQARMVSEFGRPSAWTPFGANPETSADFTTPPPPEKKKKKRCGLLGIEFAPLALLLLRRRSTARRP
jgi:hypothetical protein